MADINENSGIISTEFPNFHGFNHIYNFRRANSPKSPYEYDFSNEPTFLTFSLSFEFDEDNTFEENNFESVYGEDALHKRSPLFNDEIGYDNAYNFLKARNRPAEAFMVQLFKNKLKDISVNMPWFFQSISGLNEVWKSNTDMSKPLKGQNTILTIETLESLDLSIAYLADLYRKFTFDQKFMREVLPDNLRWFTCNVYVCEFRNIRLIADDTYKDLRTGITNKAYPVVNNQVQRTNIEGVGNGFSPGGNEVGTGFEHQYNWLENARTFHRYQFSMCEFDFDETLPYDTLSVGKIPEMAKNKFKIKTNWNFEHNSYDLQTFFKNVKPLEYVIQAGNPTLSQNTFSLDAVWNAIDNVMNTGGNLVDKVTNLPKNTVGKAVSFFNDISRHGEYYADRVRNTAEDIKNIPSAWSKQFHQIFNNGDNGVPANPPSGVTPTGKNTEQFDNTATVTNGGESTNPPSGVSPTPRQDKFENELSNNTPIIASTSVSKQEDDGRIGDPTLSDVQEQTFDPSNPDVTLSDVQEQVFDPENPDVALSDVKEQQFDPANPDVAMSDVKEQIFYPANPDIAMSDVQEQVFDPENPDIAVSDVKEQVFDEEQITVAMSDVKEQTFKPGKPDKATKTPYINSQSDKTGKPTSSDVKVQSPNTSNSGKPTKIDVNALIEQEFGSPGNPTKKSIFEKLTENDNTIIPGNVTHKDVSE